MTQPYYRVLRKDSAGRYTSTTVSRQFCHIYHPCVGAQECGHRLFLFGRDGMDNNETYRTALQEAIGHAQSNAQEAPMVLWEVRPTAPVLPLPFERRVLDLAWYSGPLDRYFPDCHAADVPLHAAAVLESWRAGRMTDDLAWQFNTGAYAIASHAAVMTDSFVYVRLMGQTVEDPTGMTHRRFVLL